MFLDATQKRNENLIKTAFLLHQSGSILPDTYLVDYDMVMKNAEKMLAVAKENHVTLYFMLKQLGHNPLLAKALQKLGFAGAVCVDFKEASMMIAHNIPLGNIGHLVQIPKMLLTPFLSNNPEIVTVYTLEKVLEIEEASAKLGCVTNLMLKVVRPSDILYSSQESGFFPEEIPDLVAKLEKLSHVKIAGVCSFPCFLMNPETGEIEKTPNTDTVLMVRDMLYALGHKELQVNLPSATCVHSIPQIAALSGTHAEPGHALTGTTPYHAVHMDAAEVPAIVYVSEISHTYGGNAYCYGGGFYRRGHMQNALVGDTFETATHAIVTPPDSDSIDYHFVLSEGKVSQTAVMAFRTQIFVTRSKLAIVKGVGAGKPEILGYYDAAGNEISKEVLLLG